MHFNNIEQFGAVFSKNVNYLQSWTKLLQQNKKSIFQWKNSLTPLPKSMLFAKFYAFCNKTWADSTPILEHLGVNFEFEKLSHFLYLLDFQLFVSASFAQGCGKFLKHSASAMVDFYMSMGC